MKLFKIKRNRHNYINTGKTLIDIFTVSRNGEVIKEYEKTHFLFRCTFCGEQIYFSEDWNKGEMKYFNKCKRGECS